MAGLLGKFAAGVATGLAQGIMAEAQAKRQQALLDIERQYRRQDIEYQDTLAERRADREALTRSAASNVSASRRWQPVCSARCMVSSKVSRI